MSKSVFSAEHDKVWKYRYTTTLEVQHMTGGVPNDPKVIEGWLRSRLALDKEQEKDTLLAELVERTAQERGVTTDEAIKLANPSVNGFKKNAGGLYFEGRCAKAALKEFYSICLGSGQFGKAPRMGATNKGVQSFVAEHVHVEEAVIPILNYDGVQYTEPDYVEQRFVSTFRGQSISYSEVIEEALLRFTVKSDWDLDGYWATAWVIGEENGIGSGRAQGSGKFAVVQWDQINGDKPKKPPKLS